VRPETVLSLLRQALYAPVMASALPWAIEEAAAGRMAPLLGLGLSLTPARRGQGLAQGMHFSVVCAEDMPLLERAASRSNTPAGAVFDASFADTYRRTCATWPRGDVPPAFYSVPTAPAAALLLSGGIDPVTPPRHAARIAKALGPRARHVVVANAGHGVLGIGCMRDVVFRFVNVEDADGDAALKVDSRCVEAVPRPLPVVVPGVLPAAAKARP
jgi:pimeloyl-ACP methyl ester carboxylesterase